MADKSFGVRQLNLIGPSGTPTITSPNNLAVNAVTVAISTDISIGGQVTSNIIVGTAKSVGVGTTTPKYNVDVLGDINFSGSLYQNGSLFTSGGGGAQGAPGTNGTNGTNGAQGAQGAAGSGSESFAAGTTIVFAQSTAPTGWTKNTSAGLNDRALRVVSGATAGGTVGGTYSFSSIFVNRPVSGIATATVTVSSTTLAASQIPYHTHNYNDSTVTGVNGGSFSGPNNPASITGVNVGNPVRTTDSGQSGTPAVGNGSHSHGTSTTTTFSASSMEFTVGYVDVIICQKN